MTRFLYTRERKVGMQLKALIALLKSGWNRIPEEKRKEIIDKISEAVQDAIKDKFSK